MGLIRTENLKSGMVLAQDVYDVNGWLLLTAGTKLTAHHIENFLNREVAQVDVEGLSQENVDERKMSKVDPETLERIKRDLESLFRNTSRDEPFIEEVMRLAVIRKVNLSAQTD